MTEFRARIGRIRMKNGGADVHVLDRRAINPGGEDWRGTIVANARKVAEQSTEAAPLVGYIMVGMYGDGCASVGWRYDWDRCPVPRMVVPTWLAEVLRRDLISEVTATDKFNEMFEWQE